MRNVEQYKISILSNNTSTVVHSYKILYSVIMDAIKFSVSIICCVVRILIGSL